MDGEHIFSATIVLVMVCAAFPDNAANNLAMEAGLGLLRNMGERGNSHMGARYELLANIHSGSSLASPTAPRQDLNMLPSGFQPAGTSMVGNGKGIAQPHMPMPAYPISAYNTAASSEGGRFNFPAVDNDALNEPFYDESVSTGMDFGLWEEGFAYHAMDLDLDFGQRSGAAGGAGGTDIREWMFDFMGQGGSV
jgi:hypothetical protein